MPAECKTHGLSSLIPQVFFDIIARVIPGFVILTAYLLVHFGIDEYLGKISNWFGPSVQSTTQKAQLNAPFLLFLFTSGYSYVLGVLLWGTRYGIHWLLWRKDKSKIIDLETGINLGESLTQDEFGLCICRIKNKMPDAGTKITKVKAEIHMTMALTSGFGTASIYSFLKATVTCERYYFLLSFLFLLAVLASEAAGRHFREHMKRSVKNISKEWYLRVNDVYKI